MDRAEDWQGGRSAGQLPAAPFIQMSVTVGGVLFSFSPGLLKVVAKVI